MAACGRCDARNRAGARFCAACGSPLAVECPSCGAGSARPDAQFCDRCGTSLVAEAPDSSAGARAGAGAAGPVRKVVTILFADLVGSTAAQARIDPEPAREWVDACQAALRRAVEAHQGRVVKFTGDGVMAVFGVPEVREDDAHRALRAAVALHEAIAEVPLPAGVAADGGASAIRVGVNTGEVVVDPGNHDVVGDAVNVAARLQQAGAPGEVLVGESTYRLVRLVAQLRALPPLQLKGKPDPVRAFALVSLASPAEPGGRTPFVGRARELARLEEALATAIDGPCIQLVTVLGSPGVGKSRLAAQLATAAATRARVVEVRCDPNSTATFAPVAAALRAAVGLDDAADDETVVAALSAVFDEEEPDRDRVASVAASLLGVGEPGLPEETFWAVRRLIENAARLRPHVFVFEDVHWAEPLLLDLIENVAESARDVAVLLVVTARPELREVRPVLVEPGGRVSAALVLEGLAVDESRRLTRALLDGAPLPGALLDRIAGASEGNPLFVRELVRMLVDEGALRRVGDGWDLTVPFEDLDVPPSIHAVLAARIDRLSPAEQEVLGAAAAVGRRFSRGAVAALVEPATQPRLDEVLEALRRKELVEPTGTYWLDEPVLRFHHALVLDAAYRRLLRATRASLHERAARWLEAKVGDLPDQDDAIGLQLEQAHLLGVEAGHADEGLGRQAASRLGAAGRRALDADDLGGAEAFLARALRCLPEGDGQRADLLIDRCEALLSTGDAAGAAPVVEELRAVAAEDRRTAWATCFAVELANLRDAAHVDERVVEVADAARVLDRLGDAVGAAKAHHVRAGSLARLGRIGDSEAALDHALAAARAAGDRRRATAVLAGAPVAALWGPTPVTRASGRCLDVIRILRLTSRSPGVEATALRCQAVLEALRARPDAARQLIEAARRSLEELGPGLGQVEVDLAEGTIELLAGDLAAAEVLLARAHDGFDALGVEVDAARAAALLARVRLAQGAAEEALALTEEAERRGGGDLKAGIGWRAVRAVGLATSGAVPEARRLAEEAVALAVATDALVDHADARLALAEVHRLAGDAAAARAEAVAALELYERKEATAPAARARALLGERPRAATDDSPAAGTAARLDAVYRRAFGAATAGDWDAYRAILAPQLEPSDRRRSPGALGFDDLSAEALLANAASSLDVEDLQLELSVLATRGAHLGLLRATFHGRGAAVDVLQVLEVDDQDRAVAVVTFELDDDLAAEAELDARFLASLPPDEAGAWQDTVGLMASLNSRDPEVVRDYLRPDFVVVDHRSLGWQELDRDAYVELTRAVLEGSATVSWRLQHDLAIDPDAVFVRANLSGTTLEGADFELPFLAIGVQVDGRPVRSEIFAVEDVGAARARWAELASGAG